MTRGLAEPQETRESIQTSPHSFTGRRPLSPQAANSGPSRPITITLLRDIRFFDGICFCGYNNTLVSDLNSWVFVATVNSMVRPMKSELERKANMLRIRMTDENRRLLDEASGLLGLDTSTWARQVLLRAAKRRMPATIREKWERKDMEVVSVRVQRSSKELRVE